MTDVDDEENDWSADILDREFSTAPVCDASTRVVLHFDLDCFYAQVEMIRNPLLRNKPLGIQQKYIIVTCNYVARDYGVTKLMSVTDALEKCPQLVLVKGEDLTHYREMSYKVTDLLMSYCPSVERLGFDENFVDVTEMVNSRWSQTPPSALSFSGHLFNEESLTVCASDYSRLAIGSQLAADLRESIRSALGLTCCAGVATNKLLAKLVSGTYKPNQQTTLLPESTADLMGSLGGLRKVPGIGHSTGLRLKALGLTTVRDLQCFPAADLAREFGAPNAQRLHKLAQGIDDSPVTPTGPPQSLSDEDSFKKMSSRAEVLKKVEELLTSLLDRMHKDGRQPFTFRLTIRRFSATNRYFSRESRQCPLPNHIGQKITTGCSDALPQLVQTAMKLFNKMVESNSAFHLTLINVCFSNLQSRNDSKSSIASFFSLKSPKKSLEMPYQQDISAVKGDSTISCLPTDCTAFEKRPPGQPQSMSSEPKKHSPCTQLQTPPPDYLPLVPAQLPGSLEKPTDMDKQNHLLDTNFLHLPPDVDMDVFQHLPRSIQQELLSSFHSHNSKKLRCSEPPFSATCDQEQSHHNSRLFQKPGAPTCSAGFDVEPKGFTQKTDQGFFSTCREMLTNKQARENKSHNGNWSPDTGFVYPSNIDPTVFSELPQEVQQELLTEWRQQKPTLKIPTKKQTKSAASATTATSSSKDKNPGTKGSQANSLLNYFKRN